MKLAIIDLDGVVANVDARFAQAEEIKQTFLEQAGIDRHLVSERENATNVYWRAVFNPEYVPMDTLIDGVKEALYDLERNDMGGPYEVIFLTSRPESMREATEQWLVEQGIRYQFNENRYRRRDLIMKAPAFQYTKTAVWKAGMVQTLEALYGAPDLLIVEDEDANINEHLKYFSTVQTREICKSLAEVVAKLNGTWEEPDPFLPE